MQLFVQFPDFSHTPAVDKHIERRLKGLQKRLDARYVNPVLTLRGTVVGKKPNGLPTLFEAEITVKVPKTKTPFIAKKKNKDFRIALNQAADALEKILRRDSEKSERSRKTMGHTLRPVRTLKRSQ